jgi:hypothetical protein
MDHQNFQEAIAQLSKNDGMDAGEVKNRYNLSDEDIHAIQSTDSFDNQKKRPVGGYCCCCCCV